MAPDTDIQRERRKSFREARPLKSNVLTACKFAAELS
jgi:hypothetical protein